MSVPLYLNDEAPGKHVRLVLDAAGKPVYQGNMYATFEVGVAEGGLIISPVYAPFAFVHSCRLSCGVYWQQEHLLILVLGFE